MTNCSVFKCKSRSKTSKKSSTNCEPEETQNTSQSIVFKTTKTRIMKDDVNYVAVTKDKPMFLSSVQPVITPC